MPTNTDRYVFYKDAVRVYAMTTCDCCRFQGYQDCWTYNRRTKEIHHNGLKWDQFDGKRPLSVDQVRALAPDFIKPEANL
jgi:hypothetical protein